MAALSAVPPGQRRNPSDPALRHRLVALAAAGFVVAAYLSLAQLRVLPAWDPVFGTTEDVLHSWVSQLFPVPDAPGPGRCSPGSRRSCCTCSA